MENDKITLSTEKELKIFMDPLRQRMIRTMGEIGEPVTSKKLADTMHISPSSAKHHLLQLQSIGVVKEDHAELIHGIKAVFYDVTHLTVSLKTDCRDFDNDKKVICDNLVQSIYSGFSRNVFETESLKPVGVTDGVLFHGVAHLSKEDALELNRKIADFLNAHDKKTEETIPFDYLILAYDANKCRGDK